MDSGKLKVGFSRLSTFHVQRIIFYFMSIQPIYALRPQEVFAALESSSNGLEAEQAKSYLALYGANLISEPLPLPVWQKLASHFNHLMAVLLMVVGFLAMGNGRWLLGLFIWLVVLFNAAFSFWQEYRAEQAIAHLKRLLPSYARVLRAGVERQIPTVEVVPGDVLILAEGDNIPADARVVEAYGLRVNNATLTGEAIPAAKTAEASIRDGLTEIERPNLLFAGTSITSGTGKAVVYAVGMMTQFGRIANLTQTIQEKPSPLFVGIQALTRQISLVALAVGAIVFAIGFLDLHWAWQEAFFFAMGVIVAIIPEGLLPTVTLTLAIAVQRLAQKGVLVKKLAMVETVGRTSVICTDKSGTLTQNQMMVREIWVAGQRLTVEGVGYEPKGAICPQTEQGLPSDLEKLLEAAWLCNNARLNAPSVERPLWSCLGDQTEAALKVVALKGGLDETTIQQTQPRIHEIPFDARRKRMSTIHRFGDGAEVAYVKGAPKEVLQLCDTLWLAGEARPLTNALRAEIMATNDDYARHALRVLALAFRPLPPRQEGLGAENVERGLIFLGLAGMMDPPRPEVATAVQTCHRAGIRLVMITGDYGLTAESIARRVGMLTTATPRIITGGELDELNDEALHAILAQETLFARMAPEHKLRLVAAFQARGDVVAVSGDGVNDAPALRKADVGIAMGKTGTDVAKQAADIILTNDNFGDIVTAIAEGRAVYANLRKFMRYIFASNMPALLPFIVTELFALPLALTVPHILAIDLLTDMLPALALGMERPEPDVMNKPPRPAHGPLIDGTLLVQAFLWLGMIEVVLCYIGFLGVYAQASTLGSVGTAQLATTVFFVGVVMAQIGNVFACRTEAGHLRHVGWLSNRYLWLGVAMEVVVVGVLVYVAPLAHLLQQRPLPLSYWAVLVWYAPIVYGLEWLRKRLAEINGRWRQSRVAKGENLP